MSKVFCTHKSTIISHDVFAIDTILSSSNPKHVVLLKSYKMNGIAIESDLPITDPNNVVLDLITGTPIIREKTQSEFIISNLSDYYNVISTKFNTVLNRGYVTSINSTGELIKMDVNMNSINIITSYINYSDANNVSNIMIVDYENNSHIMALDDAKSILSNLMEYYSEIFTHKQQIRNDIKNSTSIDAVSIILNDAFSIYM